MPLILPPGFVAPCQPSPVRAPPASGDWLHEIKHDGFRLMVRRDGGRVRLFTRNGHDWAVRYPAIAAAAAALQARSFLIDGEVVIADVRGVASFNLLRGRVRENQAFVWAFDLLELDGQDLCSLPLARRKTELKILLKRAPFGLALNDYVADDGRRSSPRRAPWGWRASSRSAGARPTGRAARRTGSRRRTERVRRRDARRSRTGAGRAGGERTSVNHHDGQLDGTF